MKKGAYVANKPKKSKKLLWILPVALAVLAVAAFVTVRALFLFPGGKPVLRSSTEADLRGVALTAEEYRALTEEMPDCRILWDIPIGGSSYDCTAQSITVGDFTENEIPMFSLFEDLQSVDARSARCYGQILLLQQNLPDCHIQWEVQLGSAVFSPDSTLLILAETGVSSRELVANLRYFSEDARVELGSLPLTGEDRAALKDKYPAMDFVWNVDISGKVLSSEETHLSFAGESVDAASLTAAASQFGNLQEIDLTGCGWNLEQLLALQQQCPGALIRSQLDLYGKTVSTDAQEIDLSGISISDTSAIEQALPLMPNLKKVIMSDCGISNEDMDALNNRHEQVQFVWTVYFSVYALRTDATVFIASNLPENDYFSMPLTSPELQPLRYCRDLVALDLGHMRYTDLSFLEGLTKLRYLILVDARYSDISVLATMPDLYYVELFRNDITDISPLLECKNLRHLNLGYVRGFDASVLEQMTWLERLWYPGHKKSDAQIEAIRAALTDTHCYMPAGDPDGSTGGGWREHEAYYEMRDVFGMHYMKPGTGTDSLK